ncbi:MAG: ABC transporter substrate-binding protein [Thermoanaerobaculum sp.]|nr:ABC transporter substrate-binding protein [Thermoanaerobaculum sp.]MDW7967098.1 ABC transporter substrate-binding protein [Thermoanaerobaculum sp.]
MKVTRALRWSLPFWVFTVACKQPTPPAEVRAPGEPIHGGQVTVAISQDLTSFNEYTGFSESTELAILDLLFPTLLTEQPDYQQRPPSFAPNLAVSWGFSEDNRVLTFQLRPNASWSDGTPVTAEDVAFTFRVQKSPLLPWPGQEIKDFIQRVEVVSPTVVRFYFSRSYPYQLMDANDGHIVPSHRWGKIPLQAWAHTDFSQHLVTAGPFRVASHVPQQTLTLARDPAYWDRPKPFLDRVVFRVIPDPAQQVAQLLAGQVDVVLMVPPREATNVRGNPKLELVEVPSRVWGYIGWNNRRPPLSDRRVRRALTLAINRQAIVDTVYWGFARPARGPIPSTMWAANRNLPLLPYDPGQAAKLLDTAGVTDADGDGVREWEGRKLTIDLLYPAVNPMRAQAALMIQADLRKVGIHLQPTPMEFTAMMARQEAGNFDAVLSAWEEATKVDLTSLWMTPSSTTGSNNFIGYSNPEVDHLIVQAREESDLDKAKVFWDRAQELIVEDQPVTFLYEAVQLVGIAQRIKGADINPASVFFNLQEWYVLP